MGLQLELPPGRTVSVRLTKKVIQPVQRTNATTHSYTINVQMNASGELSAKLPVIVYEPAGLPKRAKKEIPNYQNLHVCWSKTGITGCEMAKQWMDEAILNIVDEESVLIIDSWAGYKQMMRMPRIAEKRVKIIQLPPNSASALQPADLYFNRSFKELIRRVFIKIRWQHNDFDLEKRANLLDIVDMIWFQCKAPRFKNFVKYSWYRAGYIQEHPPEFETPAQFCLDFQGYVTCEADSCSNFCFLRCSHCGLHYCFKDALQHRDSIDV